MARIDGVPMSAEINLEPRIKIHGVGIEWNTDVTKIARAITRRNVHTAAQRDREVSEIATDACLVGKAPVGGPQDVRLLVVEGYMVVYEVQDRCNAWPSRWRCRELSPGKIAEAVRIAITAAKQEDQDIIGQILDIVLNSIHGNEVRLAAVIDFELGRYCCQPGRRNDTCAGIAKAVSVSPGLNRAVEGEYLVGEKVDAARGMNIQNQ